MNTDYKNTNKIYKDISRIIETRKLNAKTSVNYEFTLMNWSIGCYLFNNVLKNNKPEYGKRIVIEISSKLTQEYGVGFNRSSITRMIDFYKLFPEMDKVATMSHQLSWSHFVELLPIKDLVEREFYTTMCINERWSVRELRERKRSMLFERTAISKKPTTVILNELKQLQDNKKMTVDLFVKDPVILNFLELKDTYSEKDLESSILNELEHFIMEMGSDFAFLARQKHFVLDNKDYYIDLLFYHRSLRRLVIVELKMGDFEPEYKGQVELYLKWLDKYEKAEGEESPLAIILCSNKTDETIELLDLKNGNIRVEQYLTKLPPQHLLEKKLKQAITNAKLKENN